MVPRSAAPRWWRPVEVDGTSAPTRPTRARKSGDGQQPDLGAVVSGRGGDGAALRSGAHPADGGSLGPRRAADAGGDGPRGRRPSRGARREPPARGRAATDGAPRARGRARRANRPLAHGGGSGESGDPTRGRG